MTSHTTPHTTKAPTRSAKTHVEAHQKGSPSMAQPTRPLLQIDEQELASWPTGSTERAIARRAHQMILSAGAALEELLGTPAPSPTADTMADQVMAATHVLLDLRSKREHIDAAWNISVPRDAWETDRVSITATVFGWDLPATITPLQEAQWWAGLLGSEVADAPGASGAVELSVTGEHAGVPVQVTLYVPAPAASVVSGEVAA